MLALLLFTASLYNFKNLLITVSILDSLDTTPWVGDRLFLNPPTQVNTNTEKAMRVRYEKINLCLGGLRASYCTRTRVSACHCC
jgi:hypothetical protein